MIDFAAARARGRRRPSWSRTQGRSLAGGKARPEDEDPAKEFAVIRVRRVVESVIEWCESVITSETELAWDRDLLEHLDAEAIGHAGQVVGDACDEIVVP